MKASFFYHALKIDNLRCFGCSHCMKTCPTEAIRIKNGKASIYENRCIDCGECYKACPSGAIYVAQDDFENINNYKHKVVLMPSVFLGQFPEDIKASLVYSILLDIGFTHVMEIEASAPIHNIISNDFISKHENNKPLISTFCPAIVRLIQVKFPSLVDNLITIKAPVDLSAMYARERLIEQGANADDIGIFYITPCAAKIAATKSPVGEEKSTVDGVINMDFMYNKVYKEIKNKEKDYKIKVTANDVTSDGILFSMTSGEKRNINCKKSFAIDEIHNVIEFLEKVEDEEITDLDFLELRSCDQSCTGGILTCGNRFILQERMLHRARKLAERERSGESSRKKDIINLKEFLIENSAVGKVLPRSMMVLDENITVALKKLGQIREIETKLPQTDCCVCGAPTCHAFAEDIACGVAELADCIFIQRNLAARNGMDIEESIERMQKIWGKEKLNDYILNK